MSHDVRVNLQLNPSLGVAGIDDDVLRLDADVLATILQCKITAWDHPSIAALNPDIRWVQTAALSHDYFTVY